jgi:hypothetical protein
MVVLKNGFVERLEAMTATDAAAAVEVLVLLAVVENLIMGNE